jgi:hypothetical protein
MARAIERIERDIAELSATIEKIADELDKAYQIYLTMLGKAVQQQLTLAVFHLCTQGYPEKFLSLSLNQRQQLQQGIRKLGQQTINRLLGISENPEDTETEITSTDITSTDITSMLDPGFLEGDDIFPPKGKVIRIVEVNANGEGDDWSEIASQIEKVLRQEGNLEKVLQQQGNIQLVADEDDDDDDNEEENDDDDNEEENDNNNELKAEKEKDKKYIDEIGITGEEISEILSETSIKNPQPLPKKRLGGVSPRIPKKPNTSNPLELLIWQKNVERAVSLIVKITSKQGNDLLQESGILPKKLPDPILDLAAATSDIGEASSGPPNVLNLVVEVDGEGKSPQSRLKQVMAINLRLGEIEFADTLLCANRQQIRNIVGKLSKQAREYHKKQRERSIAEAEAVWRSTWSEDN